MDEFIKITTLNNNIINSNFVDDNNIDENIDGITVYQLVGIPGESKAILHKAGIIKELNDVFIAEFVIADRFKCFMVSKLYDEKSLETKRLILIKIIICQNNDMMIPIANLCYNFNYDKGNILDYVSIELEGYFNVTLNFIDNKYIEIKKYKYHKGMNIMPILTKKLMDPHILEILCDIK